MYPTFLSILNSSAEDLGKGEFILVEDSKTDGNFMLHHFISLFLQGESNVCLIGFAQTFVHYSTIGKKLGVNLQSSKDKNQLIFVDGMKLFLENLENKSQVSEKGDPINLKRFYNELRALLNSFQNDKPLLLVLDDINLLLNCGVDKTTLANFMHYCFTLTQTMDKKLCLLSLIHCDSDVYDDDVIYIRDNLAYHMTIHILVKGLETGYSRDIHGQVEVTRLKKEEFHMNKETKIMQFKLNDKGVDFFPPGTSAAVL